MSTEMHPGLPWVRVKRQHFNNDFIKQTHAGERTPGAWKREKWISQVADRVKERSQGLVS